MTGEFAEGIAFVFEGDTEKVFYLCLLEFLCGQCGASLEKKVMPGTNEICYIWSGAEKRILIMMNVVGTITQVANSGEWFNNRCWAKHKISWNVYLCYDTDSSEQDISKFYKGDWELLRRRLRKKARMIVDLAARADIEDILLCDLEGIGRYLGVDKPVIPSGRKGKAKMKALYRTYGATYHEGEKAREMIRSLDFERIIQRAPIELAALTARLLP